jgi:hypothetical protein
MRITAGWSEAVELSDGYGNNVLQDAGKKKTNTKAKKTVDISVPSCREFLLQPCDEDGVVVKELNEIDDGPLTKYIRQQLQQQQQQQQQQEQPVSSLAPTETAMVAAASTKTAMAAEAAATSYQGESATTTARAPPHDEPLVAPVVLASAVLPTTTSTAETTETNTGPSLREQQSRPRSASIRKLPTGEQTESPPRKKPKPTAAVSYIRLVCLVCVYADSVMYRSCHVESSCPTVLHLGISRSISVIVYCSHRVYSYLHLHDLH